MGMAFTPRKHSAKLWARVGAVAAAAGLIVFGLGVAPASASTPQCVAQTIVYPWDPNPSVGTTLDHEMFWAPVAYSGTSFCWLVQGDVSGAVLALQKSLRFCYGQPVTLDASFGPKTRAALTFVQRYYLGVTADGGYGPQTRLVMKFPSLTSGNPMDCRMLIAVG